MLLVAAQGATNTVEQESLCLVNSAGREVVEFEASSPLRHCGGDRRLSCALGWNCCRRHRFFSAYLARFLNGRNAMKSAWCTMYASVVRFTRSPSAACDAM